MKKLIFSSLVGLALIAFTGCTGANDVKAGAKCNGGKCSASSKKPSKCQASGKCGGYK